MYNILSKYIIYIYIYTEKKIFFSYVIFLIFVFITLTFEYLEFSKIGNEVLLYISLKIVFDIVILLYFPSSNVLISLILLKFMY